MIYVHINMIIKRITFAIILSAKSYILQNFNLSFAIFEKFPIRTNEINLRESMIRHMEKTFHWERHFLNIRTLSDAFFN